RSSSSVTLNGGATAAGWAAATAPASRIAGITQWDGRVIGVGPSWWGCLGQSPGIAIPGLSFRDPRSPKRHRGAIVNPWQLLDNAAAGIDNPGHRPALLAPRFPDEPP